MAIDVTNLLGGTPYEKIVLINGAIHLGTFAFISDGTIAAHPRFVGEDGTVLFLQAVAVAIPKRR